MTQLPATLTHTGMFSHPHGTDVLVVGCGGIGARLMPMLVKLMRPAAPPTYARQSPVVYAIDMDRVEPRNLLRQPFTARDIGEFKAEVMARRYSTPEVPVIPITQRVEEFLAHPPLNISIRSILVMGALDSPNPRRALLDWVNIVCNSTTNVMYIDGGNDGNRGQVVLAKGMATQIDNYDARIYRVNGHLQWPEVFAPSTAEPESCGHRVDTQTPLANNMAAMFMLNYVGLLKNQQPIGSIGVHFSTLGAVDFVRARFTESKGDSYWGRCQEFVPAIAPEPVQAPLNEFEPLDTDDIEFVDIASPVGR